MAQAIAFDVYGTLVDPLGIEQHLRYFAGEESERFASFWRQKQLEFSLRRSMMGTYVDFDVCTRQALQFSLATFGLELAGDRQKALLQQYNRLEPYVDVVDGVKSFRTVADRIVAFTNGVKVTVESLLLRAGIRQYIDDVVSVDSLRTFKPNPIVYHYLADSLAVERASTWLVSSNSWDVIGAKSAGLKAAWIRRSESQVFEPWEFQPDIVARDLREFFDLFKASPPSETKC